MYSSIIGFWVQYKAADNQLTIFNATTEALRDYVYPEGLETIIVVSGYLSHFDIPEGVKRVQAIHVALRTITVPDSIESLQLEDNYLQRLEVPNTIKYIEAEDNDICEIVFRDGVPTQLCTLHLRNNKMISLDFPVPESMYHLDIYRNTSLKHISPELLSLYIKSIDEDDAFMKMQLSGVSD